MSDWTFALLFRPDIVKISLDSETILLLRETAAGVASENKRGEDTSESAKSFLAGVNDARPSGLNGERMNGHQGYQESVNMNDSTRIQYDEEGREAAAILSMNPSAGAPKKAVLI